MAVHLTHHEHHGERFARTLGVPDDAAALAGILAIEQPLHCQLDGAELLVTAHDLDGLALVIGGEEREGTDEVQQVCLVEHAGHQALLVVGPALSVLQLVNGAGIRVCPAVEVFFRVCGDGAELGLVPARGDHDLVVIEKWCAAFPLGAPLLAVAEHLVDGLGYGVFHLGRFAFNHHNWKTVEKQYDVRDDVILGTQDAHLELAHGDETVVVNVLKIHKPYSGALFAGLAVLADTGVFQQQGEYMAVVRNEAHAGEACSEMLDHLIDLVVLQPVIDDFEPVFEHREHDNIGEVLTEGVGGVLFIVEVDDLPPQALELIEERLLHVVTFVESDVMGCLVRYHNTTFAQKNCSPNLVSENW